MSVPVSARCELTNNRGRDCLHVSRQTSPTNSRSCDRGLLRRTCQLQLGKEHYL